MFRCRQRYNLSVIVLLTLGESPDRYCRAVVSLLELLKTRHLGVTNSAPPASLAADQSGDANSSFAVAGETVRTGPGKAVPTEQGKLSGSNREVIRLDQDKDSDVANSLRRLRQKFYDSM